MANSDNHQELFKGVFFAIVPNSNVTPAVEHEIDEILVQQGATPCTLGSNELYNVTHLISNTSDFPAYHDAVDAFIHVVKPSWVFQSRDKGRTANPRQHSPDPRLFLSDIVVACADDIPEGDKDAIIGGVQAMGGQYAGVMNRLVTHVVALTMDNKQCRLIADKNLSCKPVLPHWFDACLVLGKKIDPAPYVLPDPPVLSKLPSKPSQSTSTPNLDGATKLVESFDFHHTIASLTLTGSPSKERRELSIFKDKSVMLHSDLGLSDRLEERIVDLIYSGYGTIAADVESADMLVCQYRGTEEFKKASALGKDVGNLNWLYYIINNNTWTSPFRRLLHYPYPRGGVPGFQSLKLTVSNYAGEARVYLESLVKAAGGEFTKTMSQENTHLITAHAASEKCEAAKEWGINMVNHLWLEESYACHQIQPLTDPKYTTFPKNTNLGEVVGQTEINREACTESFLAPPREKLEPIELNGGNSRTPIRNLDSAKDFSSTTHPTASKPPAEGTGSGRSAKNRALNKLHSMADDIALFQKESKRVGGVIYGGRRSNDQDRITPQPKRGFFENHGPSGTDDNSKDVFEVQSPLRKKQKKINIATTPIDELPLKVMITGINSKQDLRSKARSVNVALVNDPTKDFDVVVAPRVLKTPKFLCGLAKAPTIVHQSWLDSLTANGTRAPLERHILKHPESERDLNVDLSTSLKLAKRNLSQGGMLKDWTIFCTQNTHGGFEAYDKIIKANGGKCLLYKGRETHVPHRSRSSSTLGENDKTNEAQDMTDRPKLYLITCDEDRHLWGKFMYLAQGQNYEPVICKPDWMIRIALTQDSSEWQQWWSWE